MVRTTRKRALPLIMRSKASEARSKEKDSFMERDAREDAECEGVLRVDRSARGPAFYGLAPAEKLKRRNFERRHRADNCESSVHSEAAHHGFHRVGVGDSCQDHLSAAELQKFGGGILRF